MKPPKIKLQPQYQLPESMFNKYNKKHKQPKHRYRLINNAQDGCVEIRVKNSDIDPYQVINAKSIEMFLRRNDRVR